MKKTKRFGKAVIACLTAGLMIVMSLFAAAEDAYGTYEEGFFSQKHQFQRVDPTPQLMNADFSEGFRYWSTRSGTKANENAKLITEGDNTFIQLTPGGDYYGLTTALFICDQVKPGQKLVVMYDWRGAMDFQVYVAQWVDGVEVRMGRQVGKNLYEAQDETEWNVSVSNSEETVQESKEGNENLYFAIGIEATTIMDIDTCVDNVRLAIMDADGGYRDLEGNPIVFETGEEEEPPEESEETSSETPQSQPQEDKPESSKPAADGSSTTDSNAAGTASDPADTEEKGAPWPLIIGIIAAVVVIAAVIVVVLVMKKKKAPEDRG